MTDTKIDWFDDFIGLGYHVYDVRPTIFMIFDERKKVVDTWNNIMKYFPDDEIKIRFVENGTDYIFILYCQSRILLTTWVFLKSLKVSEHFEEFKEGYGNLANLKLALYVPKKGTYELEIFKYQKKIGGIEFLNESEAEKDFVLDRAIKLLQRRAEPDDKKTGY